MSRSRRRTPIYGNAIARSESVDKRIWHGRMRACERDRLHHALADPEAHLSTRVREVSNRWAMSKDGRHWWSWSRQACRVAERYPLEGGLPTTEALSLCRRDLAKYRAK